MAKRSNGHTLGKLPGAKEPDYDVGYAKPPVDTRFKPGQSGNPRGRPKGAKSKSNRLPALNEERLKTAITEEAYRMISVRDGDRLVEMPVIQAIIRSITLTAAKGNQRSQRMCVDLLQGVERENKALHDELLQAAIDYKVEWERELHRREQLGETGQEPVPHPDDIVIYTNTGEVEIRGPLTKEEKVKWDRLREAKLDCDEFIPELEQMAAEDPDNRAIKDELARQRSLRAKIAKVIPD